MPCAGLSNVRTETFAGPHPAGLAGTHIHFLDPVHAEKSVWSLNYQDVIAICKLFATGKLWTERVVSIAGPMVAKPRLVRTRLGASLDELTAGELRTGHKVRVISGSVFGGRTARGACAYLGRYHLQVSCLEEGTEREMLHYLRAGAEKHSVLPLYISKLSPGKLFNFTTTVSPQQKKLLLN